jgi:hypothetical protein
MPTTNDKSENPRNQSSSQNDDPEGWHEHVLAGIEPAAEARLLRKTRQRAKSKYGTSDELLDKLYGLNSR